MKLPRRSFLHLAAGAAALPAVSRVASAQTYPTRSVRIIAGFPPGSASDVTARLLGQWLSERLGQSFIVENRLGAASNLAAEAVVRALADGYTLLLITSVNAVNATLYDNLNFNLIQDIAPVASIARGPGVMVVSPTFPAKSVPEFIAYAKANPGKINMGTAGSGSMLDVYGELFMMMAGVDMLRVPYRGAPPALTDLMGDRVQVVFDTFAASIELIRAGKLRALGVTTATRSAALPDVPSLGEFLPGYDASILLGVGAPKNTPRDIVATLNKEINAALVDPSMQARIASFGYTAFASSPAEYGKLIAEDVEKWAKVIKFAGIKPD
ncbi:MAG TPA: tripartite tricarboxylate transporter substrate binding protein [Xanthobacteraceae bacterium]|nr:tripartite tricarboxylate transporter substrate binding protein [Xanthobacteraceae bacterium]